ncbi:MAG: hypothetical protein JSR82_06060 [Verrucomicrobia bacterium]|nr:hypothetical protein [Verrucomicrobiota bacterium]
MSNPVHSEFDRQRIDRIGKNSTAQLAKRQSVSYCTRAVSVIRALLVALIALGCATFSQACLIANLSFGPGLDCCQGAEKSDTCGSDCAACATLESGVDRTSPPAVETPAPHVAWDPAIALTLAQAAREAEVVLVDDLSAPASPPPIWHFVVRTAVPVRGPSLLA